MSCFFVQTGVQLLLVNGFDDTAGIAHCQCIVGNVARDHRAGSDGDIVANRYPVSTVTLPPIHTLFPTLMGRAYCTLALRSRTSSGCPAV